MPARRYTREWRAHSRRHAHPSTLAARSRPPARAEFQRAASSRSNYRLTQNLTPGNGGYISMMAPGDPVNDHVDVFNLGAGDVRPRSGGADQRKRGVRCVRRTIEPSSHHRRHGIFRGTCRDAPDCVTTTNTNNEYFVSSGSVDRLAVACTTGYQVTGGGCTFTNADGSNATDKTVFLNRSTRRFDTNTGLFVNEWICQWTNADAVKSFRFIARAVCCRVPGR